MALSLGSGNNGVAFVVAAGVVWEIIAFACSSPQTAEINIQRRAGTLMKWVHLGQALAAVTITIGAIVEPKTSRAIIAGGIYAMVASEAFYLHAMAAGMARPGPGTEDYPDD